LGCCCLPAIAVDGPALKHTQIAADGRGGRVARSNLYIGESRTRKLLNYGWVINMEIHNLNIEYRTRNFECRSQDSLRSAFYIIETIEYLTSTFGNRYSIFDIQMVFNRKYNNSGSATNNQ
jgi:hypothetical protein